MDGTLTIPAIDFVSIRQKLGILEGDILPILESWPEERRKSGWELIEKYEEDVLNHTEFQSDVREVLLEFHNAGIKLGIITRNSKKSANKLMELIGIPFSPVLTREFPYVKPSPEPVRHILEIWKISPEDVMVIGDYIHDIKCGSAAGTDTCFFQNPGMTSYAEFADYSLSTYKELAELVMSSNKKK